MKLLGIELSPQEFDNLICEQNRGKELKVINGKVIAVDTIMTQEEINMSRIRVLKQKLNESDYQTLKFIEGQLTPEEYEPIRTQRQAWRNEINQLENKNI